MQAAALRRARRRRFRAAGIAVLFGVILRRTAAHNRAKREREREQARAKARVQHQAHKIVASEAAGAAAATQQPRSSDTVATAAAAAAVAAQARMDTAPSEKRALARAFTQHASDGIFVSDEGCPTIARKRDIGTAHAPKRRAPSPPSADCPGVQEFRQRVGMAPPASWQTSSRDVRHLPAQAPLLGTVLARVGAPPPLAPAPEIVPAPFVPHPSNSTFNTGTKLQEDGAAGAQRRPATPLRFRHEADTQCPSCGSGQVASTVDDGQPRPPTLDSLLHKYYRVASDRVASTDEVGPLPLRKRPRAEPACTVGDAPRAAKRRRLTTSCPLGAV